MSQPTPVRSKPELIIPPCPTCAKPVEYTLTFEARAIVRTALLDQYATRTPEPTDPNRSIVYVGQDTPDGWAQVGGAPDRDMVEAMPCACVQHGDRAHAWLLAAIAATYPDVRVEVQVIVPAPLLDCASVPSILTAVARLDVDDVLEAQARGLSPITTALLRAVDQVIEGLPEPKAGPR